jgi:hypothetical protein
MLKGWFGVVVDIVKRERDEVNGRIGFCEVEGVS